MKSLFLACLFCLAAFSSSAQNTYTAEWKKVDSLIQKKALPKSALVLVKKIYAQAKAAGNDQQVAKALIYQTDLQQEITEGSDTASMALVERELAQSRQPFAAVYQSMLAGLYRRYYEAHRWQFYNRTKTAKADSLDIGKWSEDDFEKKITGLYLASLRPKELLQRTAADDFSALLAKGNAPELRPTLYDLLAQKALSFFEEGFGYGTAAKYGYVLNDPALFAPAKDFATLPLPSPDTAALRYNALRLYQELVGFHLRINSKEALIDADLARIEFVYRNTIITNKDSLYRHALRRMMSDYADSKSANRAAYLLAQHYQVLAFNYSPLKDTTHRFEQVKAETILQKIVADSSVKNEGWTDAFNLLQEIRKPSLSLTVEKVNLPNEVFRALVKYKNVATAVMRLYRSAEALRNRLTEADGTAYWKVLSQQKPLKQWTQPLPATADLQEHSVEIKVDGLPAGDYFLVLSDGLNLKSQKTTAASSHLWVSTISYVNRGNDFFVLHRKTGQPLARATADFSYREIEYYGNRQHRLRIYQSNYTADPHGFFHVRESDVRNYNTAMRFRYKTETLLLDEGLYLDRNTGNESRSLVKRTNVYFYTDRSLYRPGQTVHFKGIVVSDDEEKKKVIVAQKSITVYLFDANGEKRDSVQLTSNEFGSVAGSFALPARLLNGSFSVRTQPDKYWSSAYFSVEEYKRPKFYAEFEKLKGEQKLGDSIRMTVTAKAFAGNAITGAKVAYRVERSQRWAWMRNWQPYNRGQQLTFGEAQTDAEGKYTVAFLAEPDKTVDSANNPVFNFTVTATVTDINGETHAESQTVSVGYASLMLTAFEPGKLPVDSFKKLSVQTLNLQGEFVKAPLTVSLFRLQPEARPLRQRYWEQPDQFVMNKEDYMKLFPFDEYKDESDWHTWPKALLDSLQTVSTKEEEFPLPFKQTLAAGHYLIRITAKDKDGKEVKTEEHIELFDNGPSTQPEFLWTYSEGSVRKPGEESEVKFASAAPSVYLIKESSRGDKSLRDSTRFAYENLSGSRSFRYPITEADRGGYSTGFLFVKENRVYQFEHRIDVPWTNKQLAVSLTSFRDKTEPGVKETWKLKIRGEEGKKVAAEVLASMYDASLDAVSNHKWILPSLWPEYEQTLSWRDETFGSVSSEDKEVYLSRRFYNKVYDALLFGNENRQPLWWLNSLEYAYEGKGMRGEGFYYWSEHGGRPPVIETAKGFDFSSGASINAMANYGVLGGSSPSFRNNEPRLMALAKPATYDLELASERRDYRKGDVMGYLGTTYSEADSFKLNYREVQLQNKTANVQPRKNLSETAFFFPFLTTNDSGEVELSFTVPEALTQWKLQTLAHTKELAFGYTEQTLVTQKSLMVQPNLPRFLRQGDAVTLQAKIANLSDKRLNGEAKLQLFDAATNEPISNAFGLNEKAIPVSVKEGGSTVVNFALKVPADFDGALTWRITASAQTDGGTQFTDGEEAALPVLPQSILLTETLPLVLHGNATKELRMEKLLQSASSKTLRHQSLTVEATTNPVWYVVQALPYLTEFPYECAEQTWNRYYANVLASVIAASSSGVETMLEKWKRDTTALQSNLQKNEELKSALLQETPWLLEAKTEAERKAALATLFDKKRIASELAANLAKLRRLQNSDGSFPWFAGGPNNRYITQYILTSIGKLLRTKGITMEMQQGLRSIVAGGLTYLDREVTRNYETLTKMEAAVRTETVSSDEIQYLYLRSFFMDAQVPEKTVPVFQHLKTILAKQWMKQPKQLQAMAALAFHRFGNKETAAAILASLKESAVVSPDLGMYWKAMEARGWLWEESPIETVALITEAFAEAGKDEEAVSALQTWLIQNKQTGNWGSTKATADACAAILLRGASLLNNKAAVEIKLGSAKAVSFNSTGADAEEGTGYFKRTVAASDVRADLGAITVQSKSANNTVPLWVNVYWQYFENMDNVSSAASPLFVNKELFVEKQTEKGSVLSAVGDTSSLRPGDKVVVRLHLKTDRDLEYVHLKDLRASGFEPVGVFSGYRWQNGLGYYEETKDMATNFFFDFLPKGEHLFEYPVYVAQSGNFTGGIATAQCMYAPQLAAHSSGGRVEVK